MLFYGVVKATSPAADFPIHMEVTIPEESFLVYPRSHL